MGYTKACTNCGTQFETSNIRKRVCRKDCSRTTKNKARSIKRENNDLQFIGVDGEGVDRPDGRHEYIMLSVGDKTLWKNGHELQLGEILEFLWGCFRENPQAVYVGFYLGYDFIQWEKKLSEEKARLLLTNKGIEERKSKRKSRVNPYPDPVVWESWEIDIMAGRRFKLRPHVHHRSEWSQLCRNRTCKKDVGTDWLPNNSGEPNKLVEGENEWVVPDDCELKEYTGNSEAFWMYFTVGTGEEKVKASPWMYICDTGPFWQTSFINVIDPKNWSEKGVCTQHEFDTIVQGKSGRSKVVPYGETGFYQTMREYNVLENDILARVSQRLNEGFMNDQIPIKIPKADWYGPGRAAQIWMDSLHKLCADPSAIEHNKSVVRNNANLSNPRMERVNEYGLLNADVYMSMPEWFYEAAQASYYAGWFEQFCHGHIGNVWEYDINSAYPFIIASLPCLHTEGGHNGKYSQGEGSYPDDEYTLLYATIEGDNPYIGSMLYRNKIGNISRPQIVKGWYWLHEIKAAKRAGLIRNVDVEKWVSYRACECPPPFDHPTRGITRLYEMRLSVGKNSPQGKSAKLVYNSAYGKTAQSIGSPKYSNPAYASLITAGCRTMILDAIATHPLGAQGVTMVATDGVYFLSPHPSLNLSPTQLGAWDEKALTGLVQFLPGVYWSDETRKLIRQKKNPKLKSRGINARDLANQIGRLDYLFAKAHEALSIGDTWEWPSIEFEVAFLLDSAKLALQRGKWETAGRVTHGDKRKMDSNPRSKRQETPYRCPSHGVTRSMPYHQRETIETTPYDKSFGYQDIADPHEQVSRDGDDPLAYWRELIQGG